jgi:hypothetical protein
MLTHVFMGISGAALLAALILIVISFGNIQDNTDGIKACVDNPAYVGVTPEDDRQLFVQCLQDYKSAGK